MPHRGPHRARDCHKQHDAARAGETVEIQAGVRRRCGSSRSYPWWISKLEFNSAVPLWLCSDEVVVEGAGIATIGDVSVCASSATRIQRFRIGSERDWNTAKDAPAVCSDQNTRLESDHIAEGRVRLSGQSFIERTRSGNDFPGPSRAAATPHFPDQHFQDGCIFLTFWTLKTETGTCDQVILRLHESE